MPRASPALLQARKVFLVQAKGRCVEDTWTFDDRAGTYDQLQWVHDEALLDTMGRLISAERLSEARLIIDLATGTGAVAHFLNNFNNLVLGIDLSWPMLIQAANRPERPDLKYLQATGESLPIKDDAIDLMVCRNGLHQMSSPLKALGEIRRALAPTGALCVIESVAPSLSVKPEWRNIIMLKDRGRHSEFAFTANELESWVQGAGYEIVAVVSHEMKFDVDEWIAMGGVGGERAERIRELFLTLSSEATRAMAVGYENGRLYAKKLSHMILAEPIQASVAT
jgi:ubiquinone/menaquinone biosynthesis C-methylase UbiE